MKEEYDAKFITQFGSISEGGEFIPPTSSCYNKASIIMNNSTNVATSIPIETFHPIQDLLAPGGVQNSGSRRTNSNRIPQLVVQVTESEKYREEYLKTTSDRNRQEIIQNFWKEVVHPKALEHWNKQLVLNESDRGCDATIGDGDKLNLSVLTKTNRKDKWGSDTLGNAKE